MNYSVLRPLPARPLPPLPALPRLPQGTPAPLANPDYLRLVHSTRAPLLTPLALFSKMADLPKLPNQAAIRQLAAMKPETLKHLGRTNKDAFFRALLPAAVEAERIYGVPAAVTLAQAALESGWGASPIGGYNIFGIKGRGPAGSVRVRTREYYGGKWVSIHDNFARYSNFYEAVKEHGKLFHNGYYKKGLQDFAQTRDVMRFIDKTARTYATSPTYARDIKRIITKFDLLQMGEQVA